MSCSILCILAIIFLLGVVLKAYIKLTTAWCKSKKCLVGKIAIVTGANTGIGYDTALDFATRGARVILACRDKVRGEEAHRKIVEDTGNENILVELLDLGSFKSVRTFAKRINETQDRLDILVNNAGMISTDDKKTEDGQQLLMQTNYFSHFLLTLLLIGLMRKSGPSRIVNVSSIGAKWVRNFDLKNLEKPLRGRAYGFSKVCNILFTIELPKKLEDTGVTTYSLHPGAIKTEILRNLHVVIKTVLFFLGNLFLKTSEEGAQTTIYCSIEKGIENYNGEHFDRCRRIEPYTNVSDPSLSKKLWKLSENIVQLKPEENPF